MSDLRPKPIVLEQGDKRHELLFTLRAVDEIQTETNAPISAVFSRLNDIKTLKTILCALAGEEIKIYPREISALKVYAMLSLASGMPRKDEDLDDIETPEPEMFPIARALYIGVSVLGFPEAEVWNMTLRKLLLLFEEHQKYTGAHKKRKTIDDVIPL